MHDADANHFVDLDGSNDANFNINLPQVLSILDRRKWLVATVVSAVFLLGLIVTLLMTPQYKSTSILEIRREDGNFTNVQGVDATAPNVVNPEFYATQEGLLTSVTLAEAVAADNRLQDNAAFFEMFKSNKASDWFENDHLVVGASTREERLREARDILLNNVSVSIEDLSSLATISFTSPDPKFSKKIVDAWATHFIKATLDRRYAATAYARKFLEDRLGQLRNRTDLAERQLVDYAARQGIVSLPSDNGSQGISGSGPERSLVTEDLVSLNKELSTATAERIEAQSRLKSRDAAVQEALSNSAISEMRAQRAQLTSQYADMLQRFDPAYPPARSLKAKIASLDKSIAQENARVQVTLENTYHAAEKREAALQEQVDSLKSKLFDLRRRSTQYNILMREADTNRQLYDALLQRYKEIGVAGGVGINNIAVVDPGDVPEKPSQPKLLINLAISLIAGGAIGLGLAFILEMFEDTLSDPAEVVELLHIPLIGVVPKATEDPVTALLDQKSMLSEAYFSVQTALALTTSHGFPKTLAVTSSRPAEGKSLTSYGLAKTLAAQGRNVLLIDSDMRAPSIHYMFQCDGARGLSNLLTGSMKAADTVQATEIKNLSIIPAGPQPPSAAELLADTHFKDILDELTPDFDYVIIDAPPVMGFADAPLLANQVEGVCFVIEAHSTKKSSIRTALSRLRAAEINLLGAIVTKFDSKQAFTGYGYDYGYGYGYGYGEPDSGKAAR
ncbi:GumC family protein [Novosphingobium album (ex Hu et al. 2023)]|uniref:non-specific protein-tyrosine kinase n=1 Tax=Novosphingobium album (ex Hu et al. 2023) TaxID=2930093 RepID=A0ABT0B6B1_9SPHN|nr:polysaccharide biosynthesis tyrosine autokinase [Novosphingobium album (ex Hu et al. 2023)]MCJ2180444.1 polysaccharide biosynthesis tyrosine autokinase [Novosphingobium album (ex Hu et al. 2023)]